MRRFSIWTSALAAVLLVVPAVDASRADDIGAGSPVATEAHLADASDLRAVTMTMIDEKLALSLAVETHLQIEMLQFALASIDDDDLQRFTREKLQLYQALLNTLDELTGGRACEMLAEETRTIDQRADASGSPASGDKQAPAAAAGATSDGEAAPTSSDGDRPSTARKRVGIRAILKRASDSAILRVRLEIAGQYADMLRDQLEDAAPHEFDHRYLAAENINHMQVVAMLRVFQQHASEDFAGIVGLATARAEDQLTAGLQLSERLDATAGGDASRARLATSVE